MKTSILQHLNYAMSTSEKNVQETQKKLLRFKVKEAKTLNDRIAKYIAKEPSVKDKMELHEERDFHRCYNNQSHYPEKFMQFLQTSSVS